MTHRRSRSHSPKKSSKRSRSRKGGSRSRSAKHSKSLKAIKSHAKKIKQHVGKILNSPEGQEVKKSVHKLLSSVKESEGASMANKGM
jgi:trimethylamine:corrinoid methyltransferase-like protein